MRKTKFPKGLRRRIRTEKCRIRKEVVVSKKAEVEIEEMYKKIISKKRR